MLFMINREMIYILNNIFSKNKIKNSLTNDIQQINIDTLLYMN